MLTSSDANKANFSPKGAITFNLNYICMSFDQVQLDPYFLARIYTQPIIPGKKAPVATTPAVVPDVKFLGENQKNIALFIQNEGEAYLNEELFNLLTNILNACKLGMQDIALINVAHYPAMSFTSWQSAIKMKQAVLFGISPATMGLEDFPLYQVISAKGCQLLNSDDLYPISQDKMMKGRLWQGLKQLLGI
ncbi:hypothetical protein SAMN05661012_02573 [Chitinophaga sancti]|uniref:Uncharacterized protein n=2 Tax=Chitinophaga sancti TaxID=1004 RepID=A0A1K1Q9T8_9BACT|nr:hypothetical protein SAMN05661012_02573 [Chitinophaga sancti]